jgi:hypothetical protein
MINIAEWIQNIRNPDEISLKAHLRGGLLATFHIERNVARYLPRFCVLHLNLGDRLEEILLCDFDKIRKIPESSFSANRDCRLRSRVIDSNGLEIPLEGTYSIKLADKSDKPWLGPYGWQETRYDFEFPPFESARARAIRLDMPAYRT